MLKAHCDSCGTLIPEGDRQVLRREIPGNVKKYFNFTFFRGEPEPPRWVEIDLCLDCWHGLKTIFESVQAAAEMAKRNELPGHPGAS